MYIAWFTYTEVTCFLYYGCWYSLLWVLVVSFLFTVSPWQTNMRKHQTLKKIISNKKRYHGCLLRECEAWTNTDLFVQQTAEGLKYVHHIRFLVETDGKCSLYSTTRYLERGQRDKLLFKLRTNLVLNRSIRMHSQDTKNL